MWERKSGVSILLIASQTIPNIADSIGNCINASAIQDFWAWMMLCSLTLTGEPKHQFTTLQYNESGPGYSQ